MIDLSWNTRGRINRADYNKARWRHFAWCLIPLALYLAAGWLASKEQILALSCVAAVATILLFYYRFRFFQLMVKRLHDVNHSGKLLLVWPVAWLVFVGGGITLGIMAASSDGALPAWLNVDANPWLLPVGLAPVLLFSIYLRFQLSREGTPGPNRYGPVSGAGQAARVF